MKVVLLFVFEYFIEMCLTKDWYPMSRCFIFVLDFQDNYTPLHIAVESVKPAVIETLLGYGADVHVRG